MSESLVVIADRRIMGEVQRDLRGRLAFVYDDCGQTMAASTAPALRQALHTKVQDRFMGAPIRFSNETAGNIARWIEICAYNPRNAIEVAEP